LSRTLYPINCFWSMKHRFGNNLNFHLCDVWLLGQAWVLLLAADLLLRMVSFRRVRELAAGAMNEGAVRETDGTWSTIHRLQRLVDLAGRRHLVPVHCLRRALVLQRMLGRRGIRTELRIGVRRESGAFLAHGWLEHDGQPIGETGPVEAWFSPLEAPEIGC